MRERISAYIEQLGKDRAKRRRAVRLLCVFSLFVAAGVFWQLRLVGVTMTDEARCGKTEHQHSAQCAAEKRLVCGLEEGQPVPAEPSEAQAGEESAPADGPSEGEPVCALEEHTHGPDCQTTERTLVCGEAHAHTDACYAEETVQQCEKAGHTHDESCLAASAAASPPEAVSGQPHVHSDACWEISWSCGFAEEHVHTPACYADPNADLESREDWEAALPGERTGEWAADLIAAARSQVGYVESADNFILAQDGETRQGYTRYGAWYGNPYGSWNTMFVSFCLHYAGIPEEAVPRASGCSAMAGRLDQMGLYAGAGAYLPVPGDLVFLGDESAGPERVGVVSAVGSGGADAGLCVIEGDVSGAVCEQEYERSDRTILGYGRITAAYERAVELGLVTDGPAAAQQAGADGIPQAPKDAHRVAAAGAKEFLYEDDAFLIRIRMEGTVELPLPAADRSAAVPDATAPLPDADAGRSLSVFAPDPSSPEGVSEVSSPDGVPEAPAPDGVPEASAPLPDADAGRFLSVFAPEAPSPDGVPEVSAPDGVSGADADSDAGPALLPSPDVSAPEGPAAGAADAAAAQADLPDWSDLSMRVTRLDADSESHARLTAFAREQGGEEELVSLLAVQLHFLCDGQEVDPSACTLTAEITPKAKLLAAAEQALSAADAGPALLSAAETADSPALAASSSEAFSASDFSVAAEQSTVGVRLLVLEDNGQQVAELDDLLLPVQDGTVSTLTVPVSADGVLALAVSATANPAFTVQYYAYVEQMVTGESGTLSVIDTDNGGTGTGGRLPQNGETPAIRKLLLSDAGGGSYRVATSRDTVVPVYGERDYTYIQAPNLTYFNRLYENGHYALKEVWVLQEGGDPDSADSAGWTVYSDPENLHFTNRQASAGSGTVLIEEGAVIRLVFNVTDGEYSNAAAFYDYDITSGVTSTVTSAGRTSTMLQTAHYGINSPGNYAGAGSKLAFGNMNTGMDYRDEIWNGNTLNRSNSGGYMGCTFGLTQGLDDNGGIVYSDGVDAPDLFGEGTAAGKTAVGTEWSLRFRRSGDTYTLFQVDGTGTADLDTFRQWGSNAWSNDFWPMDGLAGTTDPQFGSTADYNGGYRGTYVYGLSQYGTPMSMPLSDDGTRHNSYFGMQYTVQFALTEDYIGPLEYCFFGDDDMWVFLDGRLVCDIGGVHSSVGEYVNLWDYIEKGSAGTHTLRFFYTERGASGSSCYMRFTLPSVSSVTPEQNTGTLRVEKEVSGPKTGEEFRYEIHFTDADRNNLRDDYAYTRYDRDGRAVKTDVILYDGGFFELKDGEYIVVRYLPVGSRYHLRELDPAPDVYKTSVSVNGGAAGEGREASGTIRLLTEERVHYLNRTFYALPETGGSGTALYMLGGLALMAAPLAYGRALRRRRRRRAGD